MKECNKSALRDSAACSYCMRLERRHQRATRRRFQGVWSNRLVLRAVRSLPKITKIVAITKSGLSASRVAPIKIFLKSNWPQNSILFANLALQVEIPKFSLNKVFPISIFFKLSVSDFELFKIQNRKQFI